MFTIEECIAENQSYAEQSCASFVFNDGEDISLMADQ